MHCQHLNDGSILLIEHLVNNNSKFARNERHITIQITNVCIYRTFALSLVLKCQRLKIKNSHTTLFRLFDFKSQTMESILEIQMSQWIFRTNFCLSPKQFMLHIVSIRAYRQTLIYIIEGIYNRCLLYLHLLAQLPIVSIKNSLNLLIVDHKQDVVALLESRFLINCPCLRRQLSGNAKHCGWLVVESIVLTTGSEQCHNGKHAK